ncbi:hypothetical protein PSYJA_09796 [Pseudomonas syringae pv. japonica str. M301072]|uniref:Uncharacterized protein n=1 Tax=Pseudomonas syringae pv. japonica str. M301072 TaxID=629262 RepID=F3FGA5_PSESX|nr:hypothetical protein PSYJA_09796 [Pseudomonas syringae pv. japonica str. M301072]
MKLSHTYAQALEQAHDGKPGGRARAVSTTGSY